MFTVVGDTLECWSRCPHTCHQAHVGCGWQSTLSELRQWSGCNYVQPCVAAFRVVSTDAVRIGCHHLRPGHDSVGLWKAYPFWRWFEWFCMPGCFKRTSAFALAVQLPRAVDTCCVQSSLELTQHARHLIKALCGPTELPALIGPRDSFPVSASKVVLPK